MSKSYDIKVTDLDIKKVSNVVTLFADKLNSFKGYNSDIEIASVVGFTYNGVNFVRKGYVNKVKEKYMEFSINSKYMLFQGETIRVFDKSDYDHLTEVGVVKYSNLKGKTFYSPNFLNMKIIGPKNIDFDDDRFTIVDPATRKIVLFGSVKNISIEHLHELLKDLKETFPVKRCLNKNIDSTAVDEDELHSSVLCSESMRYDFVDTFYLNPSLDKELSKEEIMTARHGNFLIASEIDTQKWLAVFETDIDFGEGAIADFLMSTTESSRSEMVVISDEETFSVLYDRIFDLTFNGHSESIFEYSLHEDAMEMLNLQTNRLLDPVCIRNVNSSIGRLRKVSARNKFGFSTQSRYNLDGDSHHESLGVRPMDSKGTVVRSNHTHHSIEHWFREQARQTNSGSNGNKFEANVKRNILMAIDDLKESLVESDDNRFDYNLNLIKENYALLDGLD